MFFLLKSFKGSKITFSSEWWKTLFCTWFRPIEPKFGLPIYLFFLKNLALSVTRYHGSVSTCKMSEKNKDPILMKFSEGWSVAQTDRQTGRQTERQTDEREWFHKKLSDWRRVPKIQVEKLLFSVKWALFEQHLIQSVNTFFKKYFFRKISLWKKILYS